MISGERLCSWYEIWRESFRCLWVDFEKNLLSVARFEENLYFCFFPQDSRRIFVLLGGPSRNFFSWLRDLERVYLLVVPFWEIFLSCGSIQQDSLPWLWDLERVFVLLSRLQWIFLFLFRDSEKLLLFSYEFLGDLLFLCFDTKDHSCSRNSIRTNSAAFRHDMWGEFSISWFDYKNISCNSYEIDWKRVILPLIQPQEDIWV